MGVSRVWDRGGLMARASLLAADAARLAASRRYAVYLRSARHPDGIPERLSAHAALRAARHARRRVPAYRDFLEAHGWRPEPGLPAAEQLRRLPETDKDGYIRRYRTEARCLDGRIPMAGTQIDESAGSSGTPYNWVRGPEELAATHREISYMIRYLFGRDLIIINGFSMGAWATGVNVGEALRRNGIVKNTGPDVDRILGTMAFFGPTYSYVLTGYPPFLKHLVDEGERRGFPWWEYRAGAVVGGEGMSEGLRAHLERTFRAVYSGYGASDLDVGVAAELPLTAWIRRTVAADPALQRALFGDDPRLPMLFQYNPLDYTVEVNARGELVVTVNKLSLLSPRIRYNVHDTGGVLSFDRMMAVLRESGVESPPGLDDPRRPLFRLPFLYLFGRSDSTISYQGANIYPEDVEQGLFSDPEDARRLGAYCLELVEIGDAESRPCVHVELTDGSVEDGDLRERLRRRILARLLGANRDFRTAVEENPEASMLLIRLHEPGRGPFSYNSGRVKRRYIVRDSGAGAAGVSVPDRAR